MRGWSAERVAAAAGAELVRPRADGSAGPPGVTIDSREAADGLLFVGLPGTRVDGGAFAGQALEAGAWGVLVAPGHAAAAAGDAEGDGAVLAAEDPTAALGRLARAWRRELGARVIAVTGSTGKTSTKELLAAVVSQRKRTIASRANLNTEIGMPLQVLSAPAGTEVLVLELAMRGAGQIAELTEICEPDVGVIVNVGPVHLELLGSLEAIAAAKAELIAGMPAGATAVVPAGEPLLEPHLRDDVDTVTFGAGGDVELAADEGERLEIKMGEERVSVTFPLVQAHHRANLLAALAAARAVGVDPPARIDVALSAGRGRRHRTPEGVVVIDDCYNANPMSMRAALDDLARHEGRRVAVLGDMLELGPDELRFHREIGEHAARSGVDELVAVGPLSAAVLEGYEQAGGQEARSVPEAAAAAAAVPGLVRPGDAVLVKASRGVGLEAVVDALG